VSRLSWTRRCACPLVQATLAHTHTHAHTASHDGLFLEAQPRERLLARVCGAAPTLVVIPGWLLCIPLAVSQVLIDQIRALKKHNAQLALRSKEEVKAKLKGAVRCLCWGCTRALGLFSLGAPGAVRVRVRVCHDSPFARM
jgi:hypothetical protein